MPDSLLAPPPEALTHNFGAALLAELRQHPSLSIVAVLMLLLMALGRFALTGGARSRLRTWQGFAVVAIVCFTARAELLTMGVRDGAYTWLALAGTISLLFALIGSFSLVLFELTGRYFGVPRLVRDISTVIASAIALVALLSHAGVNLVQLVTTSAIVTAVVGLALQDTLGNIIAGVAIELDDAIHVGDWIKIDDRTAGKVREVRWRATLIETRNGDLLTIPNALVNRGVITLFSFDGLEHRQWVYFDVSLEHAPNHIIDLVLAALDGTPNVSKQTPPDCILYAFEASTARYAVRYRLIDVRIDDPTDSEVRKRIWYALHRDGLAIAVPSTNVQISQQGAEEEKARAARDIRRRMHSLDQIALFQPLGPEGRQKLAEGLRFAPYANGETILRQGAPGDSLYIVRSGRVAVRLLAEGETRELAQLGPGEFFGEMGLFTGEPRHASVCAIEDSDCYIVERALFERVLKSNPSIVDEIGHLLAERQSRLEALLHVHNKQTPATQADLLARIRRFFRLE